MVAESLSFSLPTSAVLGDADQRVTMGSVGAVRYALLPVKDVRALDVQPPYFASVRGERNFQGLSVFRLFLFIRILPVH